MAKKDDDDPLIAIAAALASTQGRARAIYHVLMELVLQVARSQPDPGEYLKRMFEAISAKLDQMAETTAAKPSHGHELETVSTFFSTAERALREGRENQEGGPPPG